jgi:hypothetical protein
MLTNFQKTVRLALDLSQEEAAKVQAAWPKTEDELQDILERYMDTSDTRISGLQILTALPLIWRRRPIDLAEAEGREILYHPITGQPIPVNHPLYGLSWEMLAFLHWANNQNHLPWIDEIAIAREINESQGVIADLPKDRFYAKNMLPRLFDGKIDWSEISLAQAKQFVHEGAISPTKSQEPVYTGNDLVGTLCSIPALENQGTRNMLLNGLPRGPVGAINRSSAILTDLYNIVEMAEGAGRLTSGEYAINVIIENAIRLVRGTQFEDRLRQFKK